MTDRCGKCENCLKVLEARQAVLKAVNPPFSHADDDVIQVWNDTLQDYPCTERVLLFVGDGNAYEGGEMGLLSTLMLEHTDYKTPTDVKDRVEMIREDLQRYGMSDFVHGGGRLRFFAPDIRDRVLKATEAAGLAFWTKIVEYFPEAYGGDGGDGFESAAVREVADWVLWNVFGDDEEDGNARRRRERKTLVAMKNDRKKRCRKPRGS